ncbi:hypothetical protein [Deinococcus humi]|uniref:Uncharacterized protein n=1 Tax=Deinococcus humi TaxID=662880 RepID=A0A7W8JR49_9DEIO|nr:hypothetical protein [Deinococcus humi]MBB5361609.1 hypothetical protein [Deinococcus humi]GGO20951.1 hypothetical protein GCM10008949_06670 [Deinococcus humi]
MGFTFVFLLLPLLLLIALALCAGSLLGLIFWRSTRGRRGSLALTFTAALFPIVAILVTGFLFVSSWMFTEGQDWERGSMDTFKTPLGGGYFATSFDLVDAPAFLDPAPGAATPPRIVAFGCWHRQPFLRLHEHSPYVQVQVTRRQLLTFSSEAQLRSSLALPNGQRLPWTDRAGFEDTPCMPQAPIGFKGVSFTIWTLLSLCTLGASLGLGVWFWRVRTSPVIWPERSESSW